jgi:hypothetical protein
MLGLSSLTDTHRKLPVLTVDPAREHEGIPEVGMASLIKGPEKSNARLDGKNPPLPVEFFHCRC